jgi:hypothetical protein
VVFVSFMNISLNKGTDTDIRTVMTLIQLCMPRLTWIAINTRTTAFTECAMSPSHNVV